MIRCLSQERGESGLVDVEAMCDVGQFLVGGRETAEAQMRQTVERALQERGELCIGEAMWVGSGCAFEA